MSPLLVRRPHRYPQRDGRTWTRDVGVFVALLALCVFVLWAAPSPRKAHFMGLVYCGLSVPALVWHCASKRAAKRALEADLTVDGKHGTRRIACGGMPDELRRLEEACPGPAQPEVVAANPLSGHAGARVGAMFLGTGIFMVAIGIAGLIVGPVLLVGAWFAQRMWSTYYRVTPQRLEILCARPWRIQTRCRRRISLAEARIVCRYDLRVAVIASADSSGPPVWIDFWRVDEPHRLVEAILRGALATDPGPDLPECALLG